MRIDVLYHIVRVTVVADIKRVYFCDECNRVVAREENGNVVIVQKHDKEEHRTEIRVRKLNP